MLLSLAFVILAALIMSKINKIRTDANKSDCDTVYRSAVGILVIGVIFFFLSGLDIYYTYNRGESVSATLKTPDKILQGVALATGVVLIVLSAIVMGKSRKIQTDDTNTTNIIYNSGTATLIFGLLITVLSGYRLHQEWEISRGQLTKEKAGCGLITSEIEKSMCGFDLASKGSIPRVKHTSGYTF